MQTTPTRTYGKWSADSSHTPRLRFPGSYRRTGDSGKTPLKLFPPVPMMPVLAPKGWEENGRRAGAEGRRGRGGGAEAPLSRRLLPVAARRSIVGLPLCRAPRRIGSLLRRSLARRCLHVLLCLEYLADTAGARGHSAGERTAPLGFRLSGFVKLAASPSAGSQRAHADGEIRIQ